MQQTVDVRGHAACDESVADTVGEHEARRARRSAGEQRVEVSTLAAVRWQGDHVALETGELDVAVRLLVAGPELHSAEGLLGRRRAIEMSIFRHGRTILP